MSVPPQMAVAALTGSIARWMEDAEAGRPPCDSEVDDVLALWLPPVWQPQFARSVKFVLAGLAAGRFSQKTASRLLKTQTQTGPPGGGQTTRKKRDSRAHPPRRPPHTAQRLFDAG